MGCKCTKNQPENEIVKAETIKPMEDNMNNLVQNVIQKPIEEEKPREEKKLEDIETNKLPESNEGVFSSRAEPAPAAGPISIDFNQANIRQSKIEEEVKDEKPKEEMKDICGVCDMIESEDKKEEMPRRFANVEIEQPEEKKEEKKKEEVQPAQDMKSNAQNDTVNQSKLSGKTSNKSKLDYKVEALKLINRIRENPQSFVQDIETAKSKIETKDGKLIYSGKVKVALKDGLPVFEEAIEYLKSLEPLKPLTLDENISIVVPQTEAEIKNTKTLTDLVNIKKGEGNSIDAFFKDSVKDYYISVLLLIIDDSGKSKGKKRKAVLSEEYTRIGLSYRKVGKLFCAYYTFGK